MPADSICLIIVLAALAAFVFTGAIILTIKSTVGSRRCRLGISVPRLQPPTGYKPCGLVPGLCREPPPPPVGGSSASDAPDTNRHVVDIPAAIASVEHYLGRKLTYDERASFIISVWAAHVVAGRR